MTTQPQFVAASSFLLGVLFYLENVRLWQFSQSTGHLMAVLAVDRSPQGQGLKVGQLTAGHVNNAGVGGSVKKVGRRVMVVLTGAKREGGG
ncbi:hypothetical protein ACOMHN_057648 [Nucella lapillus]